MEEETTSNSGVIAPERDIFSHSGPLHLTNIDWKNFHHRRSIAASLVQGVRVLEFDRQQNRQGQQAHAPPCPNCPTFCHCLSGYNKNARVSTARS
ncbi:hypothetical protein SLA2020_468950 [Shorea laevis]